MVGVDLRNTFQQLRVQLRRIGELDHTVEQIEVITDSEMQSIYTIRDFLSHAADVGADHGQAESCDRTQFIRL